MTDWTSSDWLTFALAIARGFLFAVTMNLLWYAWLKHRETRDRLDQPQDIWVSFTELGASRLRAKGYEPPEPLQLTPEYLWRRFGRRERRWVVFVAPGGLLAIATGVLTLTVGVMPDRVALEVREWDEDAPKPPRRPRGGLRIPAVTFPTFSPAAPGLA